MRSISMSALLAAAVSSALLTGGTAHAVGSGSANSEESTSCLSQLDSIGLPYREGDEVKVNGTFQNCAQKYAKVCVSLWVRIPFPPPGSFQPISQNCSSDTGPYPTTFMAKRVFPVPGMFAGKIAAFDHNGYLVEEKNGAGWVG